MGRATEKYIPMEDWGEDKIRQELDKSFQRWNHIKKHGCSDPLWSDGVNMNLVRNHIIYYYRLLREKLQRPVQLSLFDVGFDLRGERPIPPKVPVDYMAHGEANGGLRIKDKRRP